MNGREEAHSMDSRVRKIVRLLRKHGAQRIALHGIDATYHASC